MSIVLAIVVVGVSLATVIFVLGLFVWGAVKDGEDEAASQARMARSRLARGARRASPRGGARASRSSARRSRR